MVSRAATRAFACREANQPCLAANGARHSCQGLFNDWFIDEEQNFSHHVEPRDGRLSNSA